MATNSVFEKKGNEARSINVFLLSIILVRGRLETLCRDDVLTQQQQHKFYLHDYNYVVTVLQKL